MFIALAKVGPIKARFNGRLNFSSVDPPNGCVITGTGNGGVAGFASGRAMVHLEDTGPGARLSYTVQSEVGGRIAQIGSRLLEGTARKLVDQFFARLKDVLSASQADAAAEQPALAPMTTPVTTTAMLERARAPVPSLAGAEGVPRLQLILNVAILFGVAACLFGLSTCIALILLLLRLRI